MPGEAADYRLSIKNKHLTAQAGGVWWPSARTFL